MNASPSIVLCIPAPRPESWARELQALLPDARVRVWQDDPDRAADPAADPDADYAVVWTPPDRFYAAHPRLKAIFNMGAGVDGLLGAASLPPDVPIVRLEDAGMAPLMAEYVLQAAVRHARGLDRIETASRRGEWAPSRPRDRETFPVGLLGAGALGQPVAEALLRHGFPVSVWSRTPKAIDGVRSHVGDAGLDDFLAATRILVCLLPLTPDTEDLIDRALLSKLMPDAYLVNVGRGRHVVDADLLAAIAEGRLAGATLDVFRTEPLPDDHPFWREPRIVVTPHVSAMTQRRDTLLQIADRIARLERGEPIGGVVDRVRGY